MYEDTESKIHERNITADNHNVKYPVHIMISTLNANIKLPHPDNLTNKKNSIHDALNLIKLYNFYVPKK